jgi:hypothetical protein
MEMGQKQVGVLDTLFCGIKTCIPHARPRIKNDKLVVDLNADTTGVATI